MLTNQIDNYTNINSKNMTASQMLQIFKIYTSTFSSSVEGSVENLVMRWKEFVKFSARRFVNSYEMKDQNFAKSIVEDIKSA